MAIIVAWFLLSLFQPFKGDGEGEVRVAIPKGAGVGEIGDLLEKQGVISSGFFFEARATISGRRDDLKHGTFRLREGMSNGAALDALAEGPPPDVVTITVPEGRSRREVKRIIGSQLRGDYLAATVRSSELNPRSYGAKGAQNLEGFLFPATYELRRGAPVTALTSQQLAAFEREFGRVDLAAAKRKNLTPYDVLTIASMVEREAQIARERPLVASVIYNRLKQGIPLGIDATTRFATNNWTKPLTQSQLALNSPYNTRTHQGLPPGPIGSPGLAAIRAAAAPRRTRFLSHGGVPYRGGKRERVSRRLQSARANRHQAQQVIWVWRGSSATSFDCTPGASRDHWPPSAAPARPGGARVSISRRAAVGMQRRQRMARRLAGDDAAFLHQRLGSEQAALSVLDVDERQPALVGAIGLVAPAGAPGIENRADAVRVAAAGHRTGGAGFQVGHAA